MKHSCLFLLLPTVAFGVAVESLPQSEYVDTEVSTNIPFEVSFDAMSRMNFSISLEVSPSNCPIDLNPSRRTRHIPTLCPLMA